MDPELLRTELKALKKQLQEIVGDNGNDDEEMYKQKRMELLHRYNDIKDAAQIIIGALATAEQKTIAEVHAELDLPMN